MEAETFAGPREMMEQDAAVAVAQASKMCVFLRFQIQGGIAKVKFQEDTTSSNDTTMVGESRADDDQDWVLLPSGSWLGVL